MSASRLSTDCPLPDDDITGFTTHGNPIVAIAAFISSSDCANA